MTKKNKKRKTTEKEENKQAIRNVFFDLTNLDIITCLIVVIALFLPTLVRPWLMYDERTLYEGAYFPVATSIGEFFEIIENFGLNFNLISSNAIYSSNYVTRTAPFGQLLGMILSFIFKKEAFFYHTFNLILHLVNTCLVYLILKSVLQTNKEKSLRYLTIILTLLWATHPLMIEPVLLSTNFGASFSYLFFFSFLLDFLFNREKNKTSLLREVLIPALFLIPMLTNEYIVTLPLVLLIISFHYSYQNNSLKKAFKISLTETRPYFIGLFIYFIYFILFTNFQSSHQLEQNQLIVFLERIFWLAPQIFIHMVKLIFYPKLLSVDQTLFVKLGHTLHDPYSLFCIFFLACWLFIPLILFLAKKKLSNVFLATWIFFFALLPFLHILMPSYTLAAERYLYCPLALLIFGFANILHKNIFVNSERANRWFAPTIAFLLSSLLVACLIRSHFRTQDWKDNNAFINSTYKSNPDPLFKAVRLGMLGKTLSIYEPENKEKIKIYFLKTLALLEEAKIEITKKKLMYQSGLPEVIKAYGLDYDSLLTKIAFLEASSRYLDLKEDYKVALQILKPYVKNPEKLDPSIAELYAHLLIQDKKYKKAKKILLTANSIYPSSNFTLGNLFDFYVNYEKDLKKAEEYLHKALKLYLHDPNILLKAVSFYQEQKNTQLTAKYAYLHGLRTGSKLTYRIALSNYLVLGSPKYANKTISKLLKIDSNDPETLYFISKYYYQITDYQKALSYLTDAYKLTQNSRTDSVLAFDIAHNLAKLYLFLGDKENAMKLAKDIFNVAQNNKELLYKLAAFYKSLGLNQEVQLCLNAIKSLK